MGAVTEKMDRLDRIYTKNAVEYAQKVIEALQEFIDAPNDDSVNLYTFSRQVADFISAKEIAAATRLHRD